MSAPMLELAEIWQRVLGVEVGPDDDFFASGGDSLLAIRVVAEAAERGLTIDLLDLYVRPTIRQLLAAGTARPSAEAKPIRAGLISEADRELVPESALTAYPATRLQLGLVYETELVDRSLYHDVVTRRIEGAFDEGLLREAFRLVADRHEALRTGLELSRYSMPMQVVRRDVAVPLEVFPDATVEAAVTRAGRSFNLAKAPLVRLIVSAVDDVGFHLTAGFHHVVMDGWSESRFAWELLTAYDALLSGRRPHLGPAPASVAEFVRLERQALESPETAAFWDRQARAAAGSAVEARSRQSERISVTVPLETTGDGLERAGRDYRASAKTVLAAAQLRALARARDTDRPVTGLVVNGRPEIPGGDAMIGLFLNIVPFGLAVDRSDAELVAAVRRFEVEMLPHRRYPSAEIVRRAGAPLFDNAFNYVRFHLSGALRHLGAIAVGRPDVRDKTSLPMLVDLVHDPGSGGVELALSADAELYDETALTAYGQIYRACVHQLL